MIATSAFASCGWARIDHELGHEDSGAWDPRVYRSLMGVFLAADVAGASWEGADSREGKVLWQGVDSAILATAAEEAGKRIFTRERPTSGAGPCAWFRGGAHYSFPSGEATVAAAAVTPLVLEYGREHPVAYSLLALPLYVGVARIRNQAHWQSDVIAGWAIGGLTGWYAHGRESPFILTVLPRGFAVGFQKRF